MTIRNPKQGGVGDRGPGWYRYYAGYSEAFVESVISELPGGTGTRILDPWNGAGTTTAVASRMGYRSVGADINPALVVVAKARLLGRDVLPSIIPLSRDVINKARRLKRGRRGDQALLPWFGVDSASLISAYIDAICGLLIEGSGRRDLYYGNAVSGISSLASLFLVAVFDMVRIGAQGGRTSNPTWIKESAEEDKARWSDSEIEAIFTDCLSSLCEYVVSRPDGNSCAQSEILLDNAQLINLDEKADAVISSPPYCTRIDYVISSWPELAVLGAASRKDLKVLRDKTTGTPTTTSSASTPPRDEWGETARDFMESLSKHASKASNTYYSRFYRKYFDEIYNSIGQMMECTSDRATMCLVAQGSNYKELKIDLPAILVEMSQTTGWVLNEVKNFKIGGNMARVRYSALGLTHEPVDHESVLVFSKK